MSLVTVKTAEARFKDTILELQELFSHFDRFGSSEEGSSSSASASGSITREKLAEVLLDSLGLTFSDDELSDMIASVDLNASGDIQFNEFLKMMDQARQEQDKMNAELEAEKEKEEKDGGSTGNDEEKDNIDGEEHKESHNDKQRGAPKSSPLESKQQSASQFDPTIMTREDIKSIFTKFDTDHDGFISFSELKAIFHQFDERGYADDEIHAMIHLVDTSNTGKISYTSFVRLMMAPED